MKNESQIRILLLLQYLYAFSCEENPITVGDILQHWNKHGIQTDRKSVYADIAVLQKLGADIVCNKSTQNQYFVASRLFELPELKLLADAVEASRFITKAKSERLIEKLSSLTSADKTGALNRPVYMDGTAKPENEVIYYTVDALHNAIHNQKKISFQYIEYTPQKKRIFKHDGERYVFSPYALMWSRDYYYAVGFSERRGELSQFRVDRMTNVQPLDADAVLSSDFDAAEYAAKVFGMYPDEYQKITLLCDNGLMRSVIDRFGLDVETAVVDDDHFTATVEAAPSPPFFAWVFTFCGGIRITAPPNVLDEMRQMADWLK